MRPSFVVGILPEYKNGLEKRSPLTPKAVLWLKKRFIKTEVISSSQRLFKDQEYVSAKAKIRKNFKDASLIVGVKEPKINDLIPKKIYMVFSHTTKGQKANLPLLREFLKKRITLIDYEHITNKSGERLVFFGRFAGICGAIDTLHLYGKKLESENIPNPFKEIPYATNLKEYEDIKPILKKCYKKISNGELKKLKTPFIIGITGHGNVSKGVQEVLDFLKPIEIHPKDIRSFIKNKNLDHNRVYKIVFDREEKFRNLNDKGFYFEEYIKNPKKFESNLDNYLPYLNIIFHCSYWDKRYPRLVTEDMIKSLYKKKHFKCTFISDLSCDKKGGIEITKKVTTSKNPVYTYNPSNGEIKDGISSEGICIFAVDNLPSELPKDSSAEFSSYIEDYVYQIAAHGALDITEHHALPSEIRNSVVCQNGKLTPNFKYLEKYL